MQSSNSSESSKSVQGLSSSTSRSAPTTSAASRLMSKRKSAAGNDFGVYDPKQVKLRPYSVSMFGPRKNASMLRDIRGGNGWNILSSLMQFVAFLAAILSLKLEETLEECVVNQLLQPIVIVIGSMLLK